MNKKRKVAVLISSQHPIFSEGMRVILRTDPKIDLVGEAGNLNETIGQVLQLHPDVLLFDVPVENPNAIEAISQMKNAEHKLKILAVTISGELQSAAPYRKAGVSEFLSAQTGIDELLRLIHTPAKIAPVPERKAARDRGGRHKMRKRRTHGVAA